MDWRIEYFRESSGRVPVQEFIDHLTTEEQVETMVCIDMLRTHHLALGRPWVAPLGKGLWELRIRSRRQIRVLYFAHTGKSFVFVHAFVKKSREVPQSEIQTATRRMNQYLGR